ncbi:MAG: Dihydrolipoyl dehydrogenase 3 [Chlamydiia bacterium]|nr:Dihydrolipoyl dehydrogenase 3 [Chlamydiia bacterium]
MADFDIVIIGSGPAGYVGAIHAAQRGLKTACVVVENELGGTCLNVGCIPSKALLHASEVLAAFKEEGKEWGLSQPNVEIDFPTMIKRKDEIVKKLTTGIGYLFKKNKIETLSGFGTFIDKETLQVGDRKVTAKNFIIATGSTPTPLPGLNFDGSKVISSTEALSLPNLPKKLLVVGAGVIGLELGSFYSRLGVEIEVIEFLNRITPEYDDDISSVFMRILEKQGLKFNLNSKVISGSVKADGVILQVETKEGIKEFSGDHALVSIGRKPFTDGLGLEKAGVRVSNQGFVEVDGIFKTSNSNIYAVGDVIGGAMLAHKGSHEATVAIDHILGKKSTMKYGAVPGVIYTSPEVASVGASEKDLKAKGVDYKVVKFPLAANSRYVAIGGKDPCFVKYLVCKKTKRLFGASMIAPHAGELIGEPTLAISQNLTLDALAHTIHAHPTFLEALHEAAMGSIFDFYHL